MPSYEVSTEVAASPEQVYAVVADLESHGTWSADAVTITPESDTPMAPGKRFNSTATAKGRSFLAALELTELSPPRRVAFTATDETGSYEHVFTIEPSGAGSRVTRRITATKLSLGQRALFYAVLGLVKKPSATQTLVRLKERIERAAGTP